MPHPDGFELLEEFQRLIPDGSYVPVLVLTADATGRALQRALLAGARDFLTKPFDAQEVMLRIRNLLQTRLLHLALQRQNQCQVQARQLRIVDAVAIPTPHARCVVVTQCVTGPGAGR